MSDKNMQICESNLIMAQELDEILAESHLYSHGSLCTILGIVIKYLRKTGHELEQYDRFLEIYGDLLFKLP